MLVPCYTLSPFLDRPHYPFKLCVLIILEKHLLFSPSGLRRSYRSYLLDSLLELRLALLGYMDLIFARFFPYSSHPQIHQACIPFCSSESDLAEQFLHYLTPHISSIPCLVRYSISSIAFRAVNACIARLEPL